MKLCLPLTFLALFSTSFYTATAQTDIQNNGNCNANISGSGNNVTIECNSGNSTEALPESVRLVISYSSPPIIIGNINWLFVDPFFSNISIHIDDDQVIYGNLTKPFRDKRIKLKRGEHFYTIEVFLQYKNGQSSQTTCSGIMNTQISASIVPRIAVNQNPMNGQLTNLNCGFTLR